VGFAVLLSANRRLSINFFFSGILQVFVCMKLCLV